MKRLVAGALFLGAMASGSADEGCALFTPANLPTTELVAKDIACIVENAFLDVPLLNAICKLTTPGQQREAAVIAALQREAVGRKMSAMRAEACGTDAGADAGKPAPHDVTVYVITSPTVDAGK